MGVGSGLCMYNVVVKGSHLLSRLLMSFLFTTTHDDKAEERLFRISERLQ